jgi:ribonuclease J
MGGVVNGTGPIRVIPLGGLGEIGLNCLVLEYGEAAILIDCGLMFPEHHMLGVDLVIPDITYLRDLGDRLRAIVITHGHEDHIGALPYVLREVDVPVHAPPMAAGLVREKLREHKLIDRAALEVFRPGEEWAVGPFRIDPIHMTHSIVDAVALAVNTPLGTVLHTGDFKLDQTPIDGRPSDLTRLAEYGSNGVLLLLSDSTNVEREGYTPTERFVHDGLDSVFRNAQGKVFFSTFSSHIHRLRQVIELSQRYRRRVAIVGRSFQTSLKIATELGHLPAIPGLFVDSDDVASLPAAEVTVLTSGSQGEALSALTRISMDDHKVRMLPGDAVILSSKFIPGNERVIMGMVNHMVRRGAKVYHQECAPVHVSGHASQEELKLMLRLVRPRYFVPIHGEYRHLTRHRELACEVGLEPEDTFVVEDGQVLEVDAGGARITREVAAGRVFVDGKGIGDVADIVLRDRRHLSQDGVVLAIIGIDQKTGEVVSGPELLSRGLAVEEEMQGYLEQARFLILETLGQVAPESRTDSLEVQEEVRKTLKRYFSKTLERRPVILPFIMEM